MLRSPTRPRSALGNCRSGNGRKPPLLFIHGGYCDALVLGPVFPALVRGARACGLRAVAARPRRVGGGTKRSSSPGSTTTLPTSSTSPRRLPAAPVLIGHSMGAAIVERLMATRPVRAAALLSPVPPAGLLRVAARLAAERPDYLLQMAQFDPTRLSARRARHAAAVLLQRRRRSRDPRRGDAPSGRRVAARADRPVVAPALAAAPSAAASPVLVLGAAGRPHLHAGRRARDRAPSRRRRDDPAGPRAHADARAAMGRAGARARALARDALAARASRLRLRAAGRCSRLGAHRGDERSANSAVGSGLLIQKPWKQWQPRAVEKFELRLACPRPRRRRGGPGRARGR